MFCSLPASIITERNFQFHIIQFIYHEQPHSCLQTVWITNGGERSKKASERGKSTVRAVVCVGQQLKVSIPPPLEAQKYCDFGKCCPEVGLAEYDSRG
jgi:hypothetical protein